MRTLKIALGMAFVLSLVAPTASAQAPSYKGGVRAVMECGRDAATRRAYMREHGVAPQFMTAQEVRVAQARGEVWSAPRCMTSREREKLIVELASVARS